LACSGSVEFDSFWVGVVNIFRRLTMQRGSVWGIVQSRLRFLVGGISSGFGIVVCADVFDLGTDGLLGVSCGQRIQFWNVGIRHLVILSYMWSYSCGQPQ